MKEALFIHNPKAAGSTVRTILKDYLTVLPHDNPSAHIALGNVGYQEEVFKFMIFRNPIERLRSAFTYLREVSTKERDQEENQLYLSPFRTFEEFILHGLEYAVEQRAIHFTPQVWWTDVGVYMYNISRFSEVIYDITERLEIPFFHQIPYLNVSGSSIYNSFEVLTKEMWDKIYKVYDYDFFIWSKLERNLYLPATEEMLPRLLPGKPLQILR